MTNVTYEPVGITSGAIPNATVIETETQAGGAQRQVVKVGGVTSVNVHTGNDELRTFSAGHICTQNSTTTPLAGNAVFTGGWQDTLDYSEVIVSVVSNKASATDGIVIQWSSLGTNVDEDDVFTLLANAGKTFSFPCNRRYVRIKYTNGAAAQTTFDLQTLLKRYASKGSSHRLADSLSQQDDAIVTKSLISGKTTAAGGAIVDVKVNPSGALTVEATVSSITDGTQKTQVIDGSGNIAAVVTGAATGVKGLRVYTGPTDPISDIPVVMDYAHHQVHEGETWQYTYAPAGMIQNAVLNFRVVVANVTATTRTPHVVVEVDTTGEAWLEIFEIPTFSAPGTAATFINRNRNTAGNPTTTIFTAPTVTATGTRLSAWIIGSGQKAGNATRDSIEWDLKTNTEYLYRLTAQSALNVCLRLIQYEDTGA